MGVSLCRPGAVVLALLLAACSTDSRTTPTEVSRPAQAGHSESVLPFVQLSTGLSHTCGITNTGQAYCWGDNFHGQLGNGVVSSNLDLTKYLVVGGHTWAQISAGHTHTCGVTTGGVGYCWGTNVDGELGNGGLSNDKPRPHAVAGGLTFSQITAGNFMTCGIATNGAGYCWGFNGEGQLGHGTGGAGANRSRPALIRGRHKWAQISAGYGTHMCGVAQNGVGFCWGRGIDGALGNGGTGNQSQPSQVAGGHKWLSIFLGYDHTCGVTAAAKGYCWGASHDGVLGIGPPSSANYKSPVAVRGGHTWVVITSGAEFNCGIEQGGAAYCWGDNTSGQLGLGQVSAAKLLPRLVINGLTFTSLSNAFSKHVCGFAGGLGYCWGVNDHAQLGDGTFSDQPAPALVQ